MTNEARTRLQVRRAGLATTVVLGCALMAVTQVPSQAYPTGRSTTTTADGQLNTLTPNYLDGSFDAAQAAAAQAEADANAAANPNAQLGEASATVITGGTSTPATTTAGTAQGLTVPGAIGGTVTVTGSGTSTGGTTPAGFNQAPGPLSAVPVPKILAQAYSAAAASAPASCHIPVTLLAAIGQVESGNLAGHSITADHRAYPGVYGPVLNGGQFAAIRDTDNGVLDGDPVWDRAVGPMQFIPGTWHAFAVDGDHDGKADPQNVFDAAATAARYLCASGGDLSTAAGVNAAVLSYNHSNSYLALVLRWKQSFDTGVRFTELNTVPTQPNVPPRTPTITPAPSHTPTTRPKPARTPSVTPASPTTPSPSVTVSAPPSSTTPPPVSQPVTDKETGITIVQKGLELTFAPNAADAKAHVVWAFGDQTNPDTPKPGAHGAAAHTFAKAASYTVTLTVTASDGSVTTHTLGIDVTATKVTIRSSSSTTQSASPSPVPTPTPTQSATPTPSATATSPAPSASTSGAGTPATSASSASTSASPSADPTPSEASATATP